MRFPLLSVSWEWQGSPYRASAVTPRVARGGDHSSLIAEDRHLEHRRRTLREGAQRVTTLVHGPVGTDRFWTPWCLRPRVGCVGSGRDRADRVHIGCVEQDLNLAALPPGAVPCCSGGHTEVADASRRHFLGASAVAVAAGGKHRLVLLSTVGGPQPENDRTGIASALVGRDMCLSG
ncbi:twin-arginine translocation signal domain-containing protein [Streptomyces nodosus]|uniref:Twin-arginine translocation signal domain-containing protein n=1 Tax=Streptomyces nodosus TaxID=40318 RepID=A0A5P2W6M7_9ACTN|nr:twin-arginine translocation signal domain-containing protein [Streptomyces nodosus]